MDKFYWPSYKVFFSGTNGNIKKACHTCTYFVSSQSPEYLDIHGNLIAIFGSSKHCCFWYLSRSGFQSSLIYTGIGQSRDDKFPHWHNHILVGIHLHSNLYYKPPDMSFLGNQDNKGIFQRFDYMIHYHGCILGKADYSWDKPCRIAALANLDHRYTFR